MPILRHDEEYQADISINAYNLIFGEEADIPEELLLVDELFFGSDIVFQLETDKELKDSKTTKLIERRKMSLPELFKNVYTIRYVFNSIFSDSEIDLDTLTESISLNNKYKLAGKYQHYVDMSYYFQLPVFLNLPEIDLHISEPTNIFGYSYKEYLYTQDMLNIHENVITNYRDVETTIVEVILTLSDDDKVKLNHYIVKGNLINLLNREDEINTYLYETTFVTDLLVDYYDNLFKTLFQYQDLLNDIVFLGTLFFNNRFTSLPLSNNTLKNGNSILFGFISSWTFNYNLIDLSKASSDKNMYVNVDYGLSTIDLDSLSIMNHTSCLRYDIESLDPNGGHPHQITGIIGYDYGYTDFVSAVNSYMSSYYKKTCTPDSLDRINRILNVPLLSYMENISDIRILNISFQGATKDQKILYLRNFLLRFPSLFDGINQLFKNNMLLQTYISPLYYPTKHINSNVYRSWFYGIARGFGRVFASDEYEGFTKLLLYDTVENIQNENVVYSVNDIYEFGKFYLIQIHEYISNIQLSQGLANPFSIRIKEATTNFPVFVGMINDYSGEFTFTKFYEEISNIPMKYNDILDVYNTYSRYNILTCSGSCGDVNEIFFSNPYMKLLTMDMNINEGEFFLRLVDFYDYPYYVFYKNMTSTSVFFRDDLLNIKINDGKVVESDIIFCDDKQLLSDLQYDECYSLLIPSEIYRGKNLDIGGNFLTILPIEFTFGEEKLVEEKDIYKEFAVDLVDVYSELNVNTDYDYPISVGYIGRYDWTITNTYELQSNRTELLLEEEKKFMPINVYAYMFNNQAVMETVNNQGYLANDVGLSMYMFFGGYLYCFPIYTEPELINQINPDHSICSGGECMQYENNCYADTDKGTPIYRSAIPVVSPDEIECGVNVYETAKPFIRYYFNYKYTSDIDTFISPLEYMSSLGMLQFGNLFGVSIYDHTIAMGFNQNGVEIEIGSFKLGFYSISNNNCYNLLSPQEIKNTIYNMINNYPENSLLYGINTCNCPNCIDSVSITQDEAYRTNKVLDSDPDNKGHYYYILNTKRSKATSVFIGTKSKTYGIYQSVCSKCYYTYMLRNAPTNIDERLRGIFYLPFSITNMGIMKPRLNTSPPNDVLYFEGNQINNKERFFYVRTNKQKENEKKTVIMKNDQFKFSLWKGIVKSEEVYKFYWDHVLRYEFEFSHINTKLGLNKSTTP